MKSDRTKRRLAALGVAALLGLSLLPVLVGAASAAPVAGASSGSVATSWAYGGQDWTNGPPQSGGAINVSWNATFGLVALFNATNTSSTTIELTEQRTVALAVTLSASGSNFSLNYQLKALEVDRAWANLTRDANVTLLSNGSTVAALGLLNASARTNASLEESAVGSYATPNGTVPFSAYLNATGHAAVNATFSPALGLLPENLSAGMSSWSSSSMMNVTSSWGIAYDWARHNGTGSAASNGSRSGGFNATTLVTVYGSLGTAVTFHDHRARTAVFLHLLGPFGLRDGFVLVAGSFDFFGGGSHPFDTEAVGEASISSQAIFVTPGHDLDVRSIGAAQATFGTSGLPLASVGTSGVVAAIASPPSTTVTAQPESPSQAQTQAACLQTGCPGPAGGLGLLGIGAIALVAAAAVGAVLFFLRRRPRAPTTANSPVPPGVYGVATPPSPPSEGSGGQP